MKDEPIVNPYDVKGHIEKGTAKREAEGELMSKTKKSTKMVNLDWTEEKENLYAKMKANIERKIVWTGEREFTVLIPDDRKKEKSVMERQKSASQDCL